MVLLSPEVSERARSAWAVVGAVVLLTLSVAACASPLPGLEAGSGAGPEWCAAYGGRPLTSYRNVYACAVVGTSPTAGATPFNSNPGFQCVELANRFLHLVWGREPIQHATLSGRTFAAQVHADYPDVRLAVDGNVGQPYGPGDIVSFDLGHCSGHTAVVVASTEDPAGNGEVTFMEQKGAPTGRRTLKVRNWSLVDPSLQWASRPTFVLFVEPGGTPTPSRSLGR